MSHLSTVELADELGYSKRQVQRMAAKGQIPGAERTSTGRWRIPDSPELREWLRNYRRKEIPELPDCLPPYLKPGEGYKILKDIHIRANSLRRALRKAPFPPDSPVWHWIWQDIEPLRLTLETLCMPIEEALDYIGEQHKKRPIRKRPDLVDRKK